MANTLRPGWTSVWLTSHFQAQIYGRGSPLAPGRESRTSGCRGIWDSRHVASGEVSRVTVSMRLERREHTGGEGGRDTPISVLSGLAGKEGGHKKEKKKKKRKFQLQKVRPAPISVPVSIRSHSITTKASAADLHWRNPAQLQGAVANPFPLGPRLQNPLSLHYKLKPKS